MPAHCSQLRNTPQLALTMLLLGAICPAGASAQLPLKGPSLEEWRHRIVYQVMTDRFASPNLSPAAKGDARCWNRTSYCGGTFKGLVDQLDYIKGLGVNAIWLSPVSVQSYGGYHGYWPLDMFAINPNFGPPMELQRVLQRLQDEGFWSILDVVWNHVGYNTAPLGSALNPYNLDEYFNNCTQLVESGMCLPDCTFPEWDTKIEQRWQCRLAWLPSLNTSHPFVRYQSTHFVEWMLEQYRFHALRVDAAGYMEPDFVSWAVNETRLAAWLETVPSPIHLYEQARQRSVPYSYQSYELYSTTMSCFARNYERAAPDGCMQMPFIRDYLASIGVDIRNMLTFAEGHDTSRFLAINNSTAAYHNALAYTLLSEAIPLILYGAEQGLDGAQWADEHRLPLWHVGYNTSSPLYIFIRTLAWYRRELGLASLPLTQAFVNNDTYAFSRGPEMLVVLTSGAYNETKPRPALYLLENLTALAGRELCDVFSAARGDNCVTAGANGTAAVIPSPSDEPMVFVTRQWLDKQPSAGTCCPWSLALRCALILSVIHFCLA